MATEEGSEDSGELIAPCLDCKDRVLHCHSTCERYLEFRAKLDYINEKKAADKEIELAKNENILRLYKSLRRGK